MHLFVSRNSANVVLNSRNLESQIIYDLILSHYFYKMKIYVHFPTEVLHIGDKAFVKIVKSNLIKPENCEEIQSEIGHNIKVFSNNCSNLISQRIFFL